MQGERDYTQIKGQTGPLVYPAGFLYLYSGLHYLTGGVNIWMGQALFAGLYLATQAIVFSLYIDSQACFCSPDISCSLREASFSGLYLLPGHTLTLPFVFQAMPPWTLVLLVLSKRMHSLFMLRLFNDCIAMFIAYAALALLIRRRWSMGIVAFSAAVSVKMNVLLMAPPVLLVVLAVSSCSPTGCPSPLKRTLSICFECSNWASVTIVGRPNQGRFDYSLLGSTRMNTRDRLSSVLLLLICIQPDELHTILYFNSKPKGLYNFYAVECLGPISMQC